MSGLMAASAASDVHIPIVAWDLKPSQINHANRLAALAAPKPAYINYAGWATLPAPPFFCNDTSFYSFSFAASASACQKFLDRSYNAVAGYQRFRLCEPVLDALNCQHRDHRRERHDRGGLAVAGIVGHRRAPGLLLAGFWIAASLRSSR